MNQNPYCMNQITFTNDQNTAVIDFSDEQQLVFWSTKLKTTPQRLKSAARACCDNGVATIEKYLTIYTSRSFSTGN
jgi:hypothetical protein